MEKRILLDTSVYGKLAEEEYLFLLLLEKKKKIDFVFYGNNLIRNELRATPKNIIYNNKKLRPYILFLYDSLITKDNHHLPINIFIEQLGKMYYQTYKKNGGAISEKNIITDFLIVASASIYQMEILVSNDKRTQFSEAALKAYKEVNFKQGFKNPIYLLYDSFKEKILRRSGI